MKKIDSKPMRKISGMDSKYTPSHGDQPKSYGVEKAPLNMASAPNKRDAVDITASI